MKIRKISPEEYAAFLKESGVPYNFMQAPAYARKNGVDIYAGETEDGIQAAVFIEKRPAMKFFSYAYSPRDWVITDRALEEDFLNSVSKALKDDGYILWQSESSIELEEYDKDGKPVEGGFDNRDYIDKLEALGFHYQNLGTGYNDKHQTTWVSVINLKDLSEDHGFPLKHHETPSFTWDQVQQAMNRKIRWAIRKAFKDGVEVRTYHAQDMSDELWKQFERLMTFSSEKHNFKGETEQNNRDFMESFQEQALIAMAWLDDHPIGASMFLETPAETFYLVSGMDPAFSNAKGMDAIHGTMIQKAIEDKRERYNFMGISGIFDQEDPSYGVYHFKKRLGGIVARTMGVFNKPLNPVSGPIFEKRLV